MSYEVYNASTNDFMAFVKAKGLVEAKNKAKLLWPNIEVNVILRIGASKWMQSQR